MNHALNILAEGFEEWIEIVAILVFIGLSILVRVIKGASEDKEARRQKERWEKVRREREANRPGEAQRRPTRQEPSRERAQAQRQPPPAPQRQAAQAAPGAQPPPAEQIAQAMKRAMGISDAPPPQPAVLSPAPPPAAPPPKRKALQRKAAGTKLASLDSAETHGLLPGTRQRAVEEDPYARAAKQIGVDLHLGDPAQARRAIVLREVLAPPKALRSGGEMWDT